MRVLLQRVSKGRVTVNGREVGRVGRGYVLLVGVTHTDTEAEAKWLAQKVAGLRVFEDAQGRMNLSLADVDGGCLVISQFTLHGDIRKGRRPSFVAAARPEQAEPLVDMFAAFLRQCGLTVAEGVFGAHMVVEIENDGPVTLMLERGE